MTEKCDLCEGKPVVRIPGATRSISLCGTHVGSMALHRDIMSEMHREFCDDTLLFFLRQISEKEMLVRINEDLVKRLDEIGKAVKYDLILSLRKDRESLLGEVDSLEERIQELEAESEGMRLEGKAVDGLRSDIVKMLEDFRGEVIVGLDKVAEAAWKASRDTQELLALMPEKGTQSGDGDGEEGKEPGRRKKFERENGVKG